MFARALLSFALLLAGAGSALAEKNAAAEIDAFMELSGINRQLADNGAQLARQIETSPVPLDARTRKQLAAAARREFATSKLLADIREVLIAKHDQKQTAALNKWLRAELGARLTALEAAASASDFDAKLEAFAAKLKQTPPSPERVSVIRRVEAANRTTETAIDVALAVGRALAVGLNAASAAPAPLATIEGAVGAQREQLEAAMPHVVLVSLLMTYESASDEDLAAYAALLESEPGVWYVSATRAALTAAFERATQRMADSVSVSRIEA
ncbi:MAG TPA: hypothetical protein VFT98_00490 [Myxococcota bacterium]|nr:hypothetical protein [Myxococcota bacterium]